MQSLIRFFLKVATTRAGGWFFTTVTPPLDRFILRLSRGRYSLAGRAVPILLLTTTGRRSGQERTTPLLYLRDGGRFVVLGSRGGRKSPAAWYLNLLSNPRATVLVDGEQIQCDSYEAQGPERDQLWDQLVAMNPGFEVYQQRLSRRIPVMVLHRPV